MILRIQGNNQLTAYIILILFLGYNVSLKTKYACGKMKSNGEKIASMSEWILIKRTKTDR
ncbi:hypothetical protein CSC02_2945 [Enterobacter hormaechei subsp. hoffmannii]|nr:hypothetical protein CSC02_2945 [Enterobacter hormaechei subsp. hoffmannii]